MIHMEHVVRQLQFEGEAALRDGRGLAAELCALKLQACLHAEGIEHPDVQPVLAAALVECADLGARAQAMQDVDADRWGGGRVRCARCLPMLHARLSCDAMFHTHTTTHDS